MVGKCPEGPFTEFIFQVMKNGHHQNPIEGPIWGLKLAHRAANDGAPRVQNHPHFLTVTGVRLDSRVIAVPQHGPQSTGSRTEIRNPESRSLTKDAINQVLGYTFRSQRGYKA